MGGSGRVRRRVVLASFLIAGASAVAALAAMSGSGAATAAPPLDNFACYSAAQTPTAKLPHPFAETPSKVSLHNTFAASGFTAAAGSVQLHCNPVETSQASGTHKVTGPISNAKANLLCHTITSKALPLPASVTVKNQFGTGALKPTAARSLCMPSWKSLTTASDLPKPKAPPDLGAYVCYTVTHLAGTPAFTPPSKTRLRDSFGTATPTVGTPDILCLPTSESVTGTGSTKVVNSARYLVCFVLPPGKAVAARMIYDKDQFGIGGVKLGRNTQLCLSSTNIPPPPPTTTAPTTTTTEPGVITVYTDPSINAPYDIATGPDGAMWFTNYTSSTIGRVTMDGVVTNYFDPSISRPDGIASGVDGAMWFANTGASSIGRIATNGSITHYSDPRISTPYRITAGPDGNMWFTNGTANTIGVLNPSGGLVTFNDGSVSNPQGITLGPDGALWYCNFYSSTIGRIDTTGKIKTFSDFHISYPVSITTGPDGALWFTNPGNNTIGRITTAGVVTNFSNPSISSPIDIVTGADGALWFTNYGNNSIGRITTTGQVNAYGDATVSLPDGIAAGPDGGIWFTNSGSNTIGRIGI